MKTNCWEFKKCGRETGGINCEKLGVCIACTETRLNGVHGGKNSGRACWAVVGTLCGGQVQGAFAAKFGNCKNCEFYKTVLNEEVEDFKLATSLLKLLRA
jgi:hypothetical protein